MAIAGARRVTLGGIPASWIKRTVQLVTSSPSGAIGMSKLGSAGGTGLARGVIRAIAGTNLQKITAISLVAALAPAVLALAVQTARNGTSPGAATSVNAFAHQDRTPTAAARTGPKTTPSKAPVSGAIVLPNGTPAKGVACFSPLAMTVIATVKFAEMNADDRGRFSLDIPSVASPWVGMIGTGMLWAYRPGSLVATIPVYQGAIPPGLPLRLVTGPPAGAIFEVRNPDGQPVVGAKIEPRALERDWALVPDPLAALIGDETVTDARGRAYMAAFFPEEVRSIRVIAEGYGWPGVRFPVPRAGARAQTSPAPTRGLAQGPLGRRCGRHPPMPTQRRRVLAAR